MAAMEAFKKNNAEYTTRLAWIKDTKHTISNKLTGIKHLYTMLNDTRYVKDRIKGKVIMDAGCGAGTFSVLLGLLGAQKVYAVDYYTDCIDSTNFLAKSANLDNIETIESDIGELKLPANSVDGIFSVEAISHYRHYDAFLEIAGRITRKDGFLIIRDGNNGASPSVRRKNYRLWDVFENYPGAISLYGHSKGETCYLDQRKEIIREQFPELSPEQVTEYASFTFGYAKETIIEAVNQFMRNNFSQKSEFRRGVCPLDPILDTYMEYLFNPKELKRELAQYGFKARVISSGPARSDLRWLQAIWEWLSPITIYSPRGFQIVANKET